MSKKVKVNCTFCGKEIERYLKQIEKYSNPFCDNKCQAKWKSENNNRLSLKCRECGVEFQRFPSLINKNGNNFCSKKCQGLFHSKNIVGYKHPNYKEKVVVECSYCSSPIEKSPAQIKRSKNYFCDKKCYDMWQTGREIGEKSAFWNGGSIQTECAYCGKIIYKSKSQIKKNKHSFCSVQCRSLYKRDAHTFNLPCDNCGKEIPVSKYDKEHFKNHFCNKKCKGEWMANNLSGEKNYCWQGGDIAVNCTICGKSIFRKRGEINEKNIYFCSRKCWGKYLSENKSGENWHSWSRIEVQCHNCGKTIFRQKKLIESVNLVFCSRKCRIDYFVGENHPLSLKSKVKCFYCGTEILRKKCEIETYDKLFCSMECRDAYSRGENHHCWRGGSSEPYGVEFNERLKIEIRHRDHHLCFLCGKAENGKTHSCHHIDYNKKNNDKSNLVTLCASCHSKTNSNRKYWEQYFYQSLSHQYGYFYKSDKARRGRLIVY